MQPRIKASELDQGLWNLFDEYVHGRIDRRSFLDRAGRYAAGGTTAAMLLEFLNPRFAEAQVVPKDDRRVEGQMLDFPSPQGSEKARGYLVRPAGAKGKLPGIVVIHENRGLNPHIEDVTRRVALEGYMAFAPDALAPAGGYPGDEDAARAVFAKLDANKTREDMLAAFRFLRGRSDCTGKVGVVGFCWGGSMSHMLATRVPELAAAVPYYGGQPPAADAAAIKAPLLIHHAENDDWVNKGWAAYEEALKANKVRYEFHQYPGTQHGFNNNTTPRYNEAAAKLAWSRTMEFFAKHLKG
jgi:carboxymethylenebutenolidase